LVETGAEDEGDDQGQGEHVVLHLARFPSFVIAVACGLGDAEEGHRLLLHPLQAGGWSRDPGVHRRREARMAGRPA